MTSTAPGTPPRRDAGAPLPDAGGKDSGPRSTCDSARCPASGAPLFPHSPSSFGNQPQEACCIDGYEDERGVHAARCGVLWPNAGINEQYCAPIVEGTPDERCLDTILDGEVVQGCRQPFGQCGHHSPGWGCHLIYRYFWDDQLEDATSTLPNPFVCTRWGEPCQRTNQCCFHPNNGGLCWLEYADAEPDAAVVTGRCEYDEHIAFPRPDEGMELPRF